MQSSYKEDQRFNRFFSDIEKPNGILTKQGEEVNPTIRALVTAKNSFPIIKSYLLGDSLSEEEMQRLKHALLFSFRGTYYTDSVPEDRATRVGITLEDNDAHTYLFRNTNTALAFLKYFDGKNYRYKETKSIGTFQDNSGSGVFFDFPITRNLPERDPYLYIYTRATSLMETDKRFSKMILVLGVKR